MTNRLPTGMRPPRPAPTLRAAPLCILAGACAVAADVYPHIDPRVAVPESGWSTRVPQFIRIAGATGAWSDYVNGELEVVADKEINGRPVWRRTDMDLYLYQARNRWWVADANGMNSGKAAGSVYSNKVEAHHLPTEAREWQVSVDGRWEIQPLRVTHPEGTAAHQVPRSSGRDSEHPDADRRLQPETPAVSPPVAPAELAPHAYEEAFPPTPGPTTPGPTSTDAPTGVPTSLFGGAQGEL